MEEPAPFREGYSLGVNKEEPLEVGVKHVQEGIIYFIEDRDTWYFDGYNLHVDYDELNGWSCIHV